MRCHCQLLNIHWSDRVTDKSVRELTGLLTIDDYLSRRHLSVFGHTARLDSMVPANSALRLAIAMKEGRRPDPSCSQVRDDAGIPLPTLWSTEVARGHGTARQSSTRRQ